MSLPDRAAAAACTVLPITLLLALVAWAYPVLSHDRPAHPMPSPTVSASPSPNP
ncbi:hypothetical protein [Kitasatospora sp. NPDC093806]|uniref:hypothetical protein n=1 Tax=Kitasatospora sp. NPDC093806 TaxID=3155075 RepID=UPI0034373523